MPRFPRINAGQAEARLLQGGFAMIRSKGSHRVYAKGNRRVVVPFHGGKVLHPKVVKQVLRAIESSVREA